MVILLSPNTSFVTLKTDKIYKIDRVKCNDYYKNYIEEVRHKPICIKNWIKIIPKLEVLDYSKWKFIFELPSL